MRKVSSYGDFHVGDRVLDIQNNNLCVIESITYRSGVDTMPYIAVYEQPKTSVYTVAWYPIFHYTQFVTLFRASSETLARRKFDKELEQLLEE